ncbi:MAG: SEC-C domain-containing protein [Elusimicrobia bacterium]|nr:SEC-C domain-containing protein [Elusimicrobiota bacterium]
MTQAIGRNDPCPCGSGRKYKRCCLPKEEADRQAEARDSRMGSPDEPDGKLRRRIMRFLEEKLPDRDDHLREATSVWLGRSRDDPGPSFNQEWEDSEFIAFMDYVVHDFIARGYDTPALELFYRQEGSTLPKQERTLLECWRENHVGFYEVQDVRKEEGTVVKDLLLGEKFFVSDVSSSRQLEQWDIFAGRVLKEPDRHVISGTALRIPRSQRIAVLEEVQSRWHKAARTRNHATFRAFMKDSWPEVRRFILEQGNRLPDIRTGTGEPMLISRAWYEVLDHPEVKKRIGAMPGIEHMGLHEDPQMKGERYDWVTSDPAAFVLPGEEGVSFQSTWYGPDQKARGLVLGNITLFERELEVQCMSRERLERLTAMLEERMGAAVRRKGTLFQEMEKALEQFRRAGKQDEETRSGIPPEIERRLLKKYFTDYYTRWVDMPIPALDNLTPRQAARNPAYRTRLEDLLKDFEQTERNPAGPPITGFSQVRLIRRLLGLDVKRGQRVK